AAQVALDLVVALDVVAEQDQLVVGQILDADVTGDPGVFEGGERASAAHSVDVCQCDFHALFARDVHAGKTCHGGFLLERVGRLGHHRCSGLPTRGVTASPRI